MTILELEKRFIKLVNEAAYAHDEYTVMHDACRMMAVAIHNRFNMGESFRKYEQEFEDCRKKYGENFTKIAELFAITVEALELRREDFLGNLMSQIGTTAKSFGQFLTPTCVSKLMARINADGTAYTPGQIVKLSDPACGASVTLIEGAEAFIAKGVRQADIYILAEDLEDLAFSTSYVQLSLLGYAARVTRMNSLSRQVFEGPWYTPGFYLHGMPMRLAAERAKEKVA